MGALFDPSRCQLLLSHPRPLAPQVTGCEGSSTFRHSHCVHAAAQRRVAAFRRTEHPQCVGGGSRPHCVEAEGVRCVLKLLRSTG